MFASSEVNSISPRAERWRAVDSPHLLPYGLAAGRYHPTPVTRPRNPMRFAFCGVLSPWKAPMLAIEAVRASSAPLSLSVWGNASEPMFADYITKLRGAAGDDPRIHFAGAYGESDAAGVFADMDALVVPSTWYENTPFVVLEAFAAGVPVIASDLGGLREIVHHEHDGLLFRAGDATALRDSMQRLIDDQKLYGRLRPPIPPTVASNYDTLAAIYAQPPLSR